MNIPSYVSGAIFAKAHSILRQVVRGCLNQHDLTPTAWAILGAVLQASPDGIRPASVSDRLGVKAPLVTALTNDLIERRLLRRIPHHTDGRAKLLVITPVGKRFVSQVESDMTASLSALLQGLAPQDLKGYQRVLEAIIKNGS